MRGQNIYGCWHNEIDLARVTKLSVDFRCPAGYAEKQHKDDVATLKKKWKFL